MSEPMLGTTTTTEGRGISSHARDYGNLVHNPHNLLELSYDELEAKNLEIKEERLRGAESEDLKERLLNYLREEKGIKAVSVCFSDLEGRLHILDYDRKFLVDAHENLTFDGSSIRGFTAQSESDLRLKIDWTSFRWVPADVFGPGKVLVFSNVCDKDGSLFEGDYRGHLYKLSKELRSEKGLVVNMAPEIEGFIFKGVKAEQTFNEKDGFELATMSGYFNCLPQDTLRQFIDRFASVQRALGFQNEKDHPEVAPAQFELNFKYSVVLDSADQIQLYKLLARQVAKSMGLTASFLPKPVQYMNGSGMHTNMSLSKDGENIFYDGSDDNNLSATAYDFINGILDKANELCLLMNSSVNAYRRLDPHYEAPNEIKMSPVDRGSMVRIPIGNAKSARIEVRTVAPDANPYLYLYALVKAGIRGIEASESEKMAMKEIHNREVEMLPGEITQAIEHFEKGEYVKGLMGERNHASYAELKRMVADRSPRALGTYVKTGEVLYHHEVTNQMIWSKF